jgi:hypothetical protein
MKGNEGYWGGGISIITQNFPKSPSILFHPLQFSISQTSPHWISPPRFSPSLDLERQPAPTVAQDPLPLSLDLTTPTLPLSGSRAADNCAAARPCALAGRATRGGSSRARASSSRCQGQLMIIIHWKGQTSHRPAVLFSQNKPATNNQPTVLFSQNKPAPAISHQPTEQAGRCIF